MPVTDRAAEVMELRELARALAERNAQLETALQSRIVIEQAKGILAERYGIAPDEAFARLRRAARSNQMNLHALAASVIAARGRPTARPAGRTADVFPAPPAAA